MLKLGFAQAWVALIIRCITSAKFSILLNWSPIGSIIPTRGIRQGDPLSSYLFVLCAEGLSKLLYDANTSGHLHGHAFSPRALLSLICYLLMIT